MEASATEMMATRMVIGRLMAIRTNHIASLLSPPFRDYGFTWRSRAATKVSRILCVFVVSAAKQNSPQRHQEPQGTWPRACVSASLLQVRRQISLDGSNRQERPPDADPGQRIVDLGLNQQPFGLGHIHDGRQSGFIAGGRLLLKHTRGSQLNGSILSHATSALQACLGLFELPIQVLEKLIIARRLRALVMELN